LSNTENIYTGTGDGGTTLIDGLGRIPSPSEKNITEAKTTQGEIASYLTEMFNKAYSPYYEGLRYEIGSYSESVDGGAVSATFYWTMHHLNIGLDAGCEIGVEEQGNFDLQATAQLDGNGAVISDTIEILSNTAARGSAEYTLPVEDFFSDLPAPTQTLLAAKINSSASAAARRFIAANGLSAKEPNTIRLAVIQAPDGYDAKLLKDDTAAFSIEFPGDPQSQLERYIVLTRGKNGEWEIVDYKTKARIIE
jgi:hypothetical protein